MKVNRPIEMESNSKQTTTSTATEGPIQNIYSGNRSKYWHSFWGESVTGHHDDQPDGTGHLGEETTFMLKIEVSLLEKIDHNDNSGAIRAIKIILICVHQRMLVVVSNLVQSSVPFEHL